MYYINSKRADILRYITLMVILSLLIWIQYFLRFFRGTGPWAKCRYRHKAFTDCQKTSPYRSNKGYKHLTVPVLDQSVLITDGLVPVLCPGAGAEERPQEILFIFFFMDLVIFGLNPLLNLPIFSFSRLGLLLILIDFSSSWLRLVLRLGLIILY